MTGEHDGMDPGELSEEYRRFMDALGTEGLRRLLEHLTEAVEANPDDTEALTARGLAYAELGDRRRAVEDYGRVIALDPDNVDAYLERARAYSELEEYRSALEDYDAAIRLAPGNAVAHYSRGGCNSELGNLAEAVNDFDVAVLLAPDDALAHYNRGLTYVAMGEPLRAVEALGRAIELDLGEADRPLPQGNGIPRPRERWTRPWTTSARPSGWNVTTVSPTTPGESPSSTFGDTTMRWATSTPS